MSIDAANPLIVQSDHTLLLDVHAPKAEEARAAIMAFSELEKSPEHIHTFRITPLSLWNAASAGFGPDDVAAALEAFSRYPVPQSILEGFSDTMARYGKIRLVARDAAEPPSNHDTGAEAGAAKPAAAALPEELLLVADDTAILAEIGAAKILDKYLRRTGDGYLLRLTDRGSVKRELIRMGWPVQDMAPLINGEALEVRLRSPTAAGRPFVLRDYQTEAARSVLGNNGPGAGYGVVVLPCGSGKTRVGMAVMGL
jgi:DNA excision repair protein ERCC-3